MDGSERTRTTRITAGAAVALLLAFAAPGVTRPVGAVAAASPVALSAAAAPQGGSFEVRIEGCSDLMQLPEATLVFENANGVRISADASGPDGRAADGRWIIGLTVPGWARSGSATVEANCVDHQPMHGGDGATDDGVPYAPLPFTILPGASDLGSVRPLVSTPVRDGTVTVSGTGCSGSVDVGISNGRDLVVRNSNFRYGAASDHVVTGPDAAGNWSVSVTLRYVAEAWTDPAAPGAYAAFARCSDSGGFSYRPVRFRIDRTSPRPLLHHAFGGNVVNAMQCPEGNWVLVLGLVLRSDGSLASIGGTAPGRARHANFVWLDVPEDTVAMLLNASCMRGFEVAWDYAPLRLPAA